MTDPIVSLSHAATCLALDDLVLAADSVLNDRPHLRGAWRALVATRPREDRKELLLADGICESGIETRVWLWLHRQRIRAVRQVDIALVGRVDFVIGDRLVIEVDGETYHADTDQFETDRTRDAALAAQGYRVLRFSYRQVMHRFDEVTAAIRSALARDAHRFRPGNAG
jgi:very-short-patch-repair endonuclease